MEGLDQQPRWAGLYASYCIVRRRHSAELRGKVLHEACISGFALTRRLDRAPNEAGTDCSVLPRIAINVLLACSEE